MTIDYVIEQLTRIKEVHGNLKLVGADDAVFSYLKLQKYFELADEDGRITSTETENLSENYIEQMYDREDLVWNTHKIASRELCVKLY